MIKLLIGSTLLLAMVIMDYVNVIDIDKINGYVSDNINTLKVVSKINGKLNLIDVDDDILVNANIEEHEGKVETNINEGVKSFKTGVVIKIERNNKYKVYILTIDDVIYIYDNLDQINIHIYETVKQDTIIGYSTDYYILTKKYEK